MKKLLLSSLAIASLMGLQLDGKSSKSTKAPVTKVKGYTKKSGKTVAPHDRTAPNKTEADNWSTRGNTNPETGKNGTKDPKK